MRLLLTVVVVIASAVTPRAISCYDYERVKLKGDLFSGFLYHCIKKDAWTVDPCISEGCDMWSSCPSCFTPYAQCHHLLCSDECASLPENKTCAACLDTFHCRDGILSCTGLAKLPPLATKESDKCLPKGHRQG